MLKIKEYIAKKNICTDDDDDEDDDDEDEEEEEEEECFLTTGK